MQTRQAHAQAFSVAAADVNTRATFIMKTYNHLFGALLLFTGIEILLFQTGVAQKIALAMSGVSWLLVLGGFMVVSWFASRVASSATSKPAQYAALVGFVAAWSLMFVPLLYIAARFHPGVIASAAWITFFGFAGLTAVAFVTRKDFSFLRGFLMWGGIVAVLLIIASVVFGWHLGTWFSVGMIGFAGAAVLYDTSNVLHHYPEDRYVSASLQLFASIALMLWYVIQLLMSFGRD